MAGYALSKVLSVAEEEVGYLEKRSNSNLDSKTGNAGQNNYTKYWRDLKCNGYQGQPWCQCFVDWCFMKAYGEAGAKKLLHQGGWEFYTPSAASYFKNASKWHSVPKTGDIIYFRNSSRICHVGIVRKVSGGIVYTIEGNTSGGSEIIPNGGGVCRKSYNIGNSRIAGYGRPSYTDTATGDKAVAKGQANANKFLGSHMEDPVQIDTDGEYGPQTEKQCARVLQQALNLDYKAKLKVDGEIGPNTKAAMKGKSIKKGDKKYLCLAAKIIYQCHGKDGGMKYTRTFGSGLEKAVGKAKIAASELLALLD